MWGFGISNEMKQMMIKKACAVYDKICSEACAVYDKICSEAYAVYDKACSEARTVRGKTCSEAWIKIWKNKKNCIKVWR